MLLLGYIQGHVWSHTVSQSGHCDPGYTIWNITLSYYIETMVACDDLNILGIYLGYVLGYSFD